jgi:hypothetical protein
MDKEIYQALLRIEEKQERIEKELEAIKLVLTRYKIVEKLVFGAVVLILLSVFGNMIEPQRIVKAQPASVNSK